MGKCQTIHVGAFYSFGWGSGIKIFWKISHRKEDQVKCFIHRLNVYKLLLKIQEMRVCIIHIYVHKFDAIGQKTVLCFN